MRCFCLHFSDFNVLFFQKNEKTCCSLLLKKLVVQKKRKKITCHEEKSQSLDIKMVRPLAFSQRFGTALCHADFVWTSYGITL